MPSKSLGRGLGMISDIFLSAPSDGITQNYQPVKPELFQDKTGATCHSCKNFISVCSDPTCKIYTFDFERFHEPYLAKIDLSSATICRYYLPTVKISIKDEKIENDCFHIQTHEAISINREFAVPNNSESQNYIRKILFKNLEEGFEIKRVVMDKKEETIGKNKTESKNTEVIIFIADNP